MYIGIIAYSVSGHTWQLAEELRDQLMAKGHAVELKAIRVVGPTRLQNENAPLVDIPPVKGYHAVVIASPVRGGLVPSPMLRYLEQLPPMPNMPVACMTTSFFRYEWGRKQVMTHMRELLTLKGAEVKGCAGLRWFSLHRNRDVKQAVKKLVLMFS